MTLFERFKRILEKHDISEPIVAVRDEYEIKFIEINEPKTQEGYEASLDISILLQDDGKMLH